MFWHICLFLVFVIHNSESARILAVFPTPSISHQIVYRKYTQALAERGHELVIATPDPAEPKNLIRDNITEIDLHDISYKFWIEKFVPEMLAHKYDPVRLVQLTYKLLITLFEIQMEQPEMQTIINNENEKFDLIVLELFVKSSVGLTHRFKTPAIAISSLPPLVEHCDIFGVPKHSLLYPNPVALSVKNLTVWQKIKEIYRDIRIQYIVENYATEEHASIKKIFGNDCPEMKELYNNLDMMFINMYHMFELNRPVPPNVVFLGGIHLEPVKALPKDLKDYLDNSTKGVIYMSLGTNTLPSLQPEYVQKIIYKVFSEMPYNVLLKWDTDDYKDKFKNIETRKWFPQNDLLRHPNIKLFITQGGLQSTDEAIDAGVPLIGIPVFADQYLNTEKYEIHGIGIRLDINTLTEQKFRGSIEKVLNDQSYRNNMKRFRDLILDEPQSPLERAVWWTEYVLRHGGAKHLRSPAANISWTEYLMFDVVAVLILFIVIILTFIWFIIKTVSNMFKNKLQTEKKYN